VIPHLAFFDETLAGNSDGLALANSLTAVLLSRVVVEPDQQGITQGYTLALLAHRQRGQQERLQARYLPKMVGLPVP
jgi:hypothetical protein